jgi:hypothetical protein
LNRAHKTTEKIRFTKQAKTPAFCFSGKGLPLLPVFDASLSCLRDALFRNSNYRFSTPRKQDSGF